MNDKRLTNLSYSSVVVTAVLAAFFKQWITVELDTRKMNWFHVGTIKLSINFFLFIILAYKIGRISSFE